MADQKATDPPITSPYRSRRQTSKSVGNVHDLVGDIDVLIPKTHETNKIIISSQDAEIIKSKLFELCQQGDIDRSDHISFDEFSSVIKKFLPNTTDTKIHKMFGAFDATNSGTVSYVEFLADANFDKFLQYCGYFTDHRATTSAQKHDKEIIMAQEEIIAKLNAWITDVGKPSETQCKELHMLRIQNESLHQELSVVPLQFEAIKQELMKLMEEKESIQNELETAGNDKDMLSHKLKHIKEQLQQSKDALEHYHKLEAKWKDIETENINLRQDNVRLTNKIDDELCIISAFEKTTSKMHQASVTNLDQIVALNEGAGAYEDMIIDLKDELETANDIISKRNAEIARLKERLRFHNDSEDRSSSEGGHGGLSFQPTLRLAGQYTSGRSLNMHSLKTPMNNAANAGADTAALDLDHNSNINWDSAEYHRFHDDPSDISEHAHQHEELQEHRTELSLEMKISEYQMKETQWNKVKEDMKMETERLHKELNGIKSQMEEERKSHDREIETLIESHLQRELHIGGVQERSESIESDILSANENAPFIPPQDRNGESGNAGNNPVCCGWRWW